MSGSYTNEEGLAIWGEGTNDITMIWPINAGVEW